MRPDEQGRMVRGASLNIKYIFEMGRRRKCQIVYYLDGDTTSASSAPSWGIFERIWLSNKQCTNTYMRLPPSNATMRHKT
jgi:hypothetical protein